MLVACCLLFVDRCYYLFVVVCRLLFDYRYFRVCCLLIADCCFAVSFLYCGSFANVWPLVVFAS